MPAFVWTHETKSYHFAQEHRQDPKIHDHVLYNNMGRSSSPLESVPDDAYLMFKCVKICFSPHLHNIIMYRILHFLLLLWQFFLADAEGETQNVLDIILLVVCLFLFYRMYVLDYYILCCLPSDIRLEGRSGFNREIVRGRQAAKNSWERGEGRP